MVITSSSDSSIKLQSGELSLSFAPKNSEGSSRSKSNILIKTSAKFDLPEGAADFCVYGPGEYEVKEIEIEGYEPFSYVVRMEEMRIGYLSSDALIDNLMGSEILITEGNPEFAKTIRQIEPMLVIIKEGDAKALAKELGVELESTDKVSLKKKDLNNYPILKVFALS